MTGASEVSANTGIGAATVGEWLANLQPPPPVALADRLTELLKADLQRPVADVPEVCLQKGEQMLSELVKSGSTERDTALTLLAVDALVTYAFDAASGDPAHIEERAANAMKRIAHRNTEIKG
ncbi:MAG: hypothetical protein ABI852_20180, partial [Gemmatimonadaceae bacterium]